MKTRVVTTNPAGHTVSVFDGMLTAYQVADNYIEFYDDIDIFHIEDTIPNMWLLKCHNAGKDPDLYQIKWTNLY